MKKSSEMSKRSLKRGSKGLGGVVGHENTAGRHETQYLDGGGVPVVDVALRGQVGL